MPKRSNKFQKLIFLVKQQVTDNAVVTESEMLIDLITGTEREVDICIKASIGGHSVIISIECTDRHRKAEVGWVERMKAKHERLPTNRLVLVSSSGFYQEATNVARTYGIETLSLEDVSEQSVSRILGDTQSLFAKVWSPVPEKVVVRLAVTLNLPAEDVVVQPDHHVHIANGTVIANMKGLVYSILGVEDIVKAIARLGETTHKGFIFECNLPKDKDGNPLYMQKLEPVVLREIESIHVEGSCNFNITEFPLKRVNLGSQLIAWGEGEFLG